MPVGLMTARVLIVGGARTVSTKMKDPHVALHSTRPSAWT